MKKISRRTAIQTASAGALAAVGMGSGRWLNAEQTEPIAAPMPPLRELLLPGFHAYANGQSVAAGEQIHFYISSSVPYEFSVVKLGHRIDDPTSDTVLHSFGKTESRQQTISPGSFIWVEKGLPIDVARQPIALECWIRLFRVEDGQGVITLGSSANGFCLFISPLGELQFRCGATATGPKLKTMQWYHVVAQWDGKTVATWVNGEPVGSAQFAGKMDLPPAAILLGAAEVDGRINHFLEGDIAMPAIYQRRLGADEIKRRYSERGLLPAEGDDLLACWPLSEEQGDQVSDNSRHSRHGKIINHATWMIGGPSFDGSKVPRYDKNYSPQCDATRGHGLRFAGDDLYDCNWQPTHDFTIPVTAKSGLYCARATFELDGKAMVYQVTFIVRKPAAQAKAPILVLCSSNTWLAYNATPFAANHPPGLMWNTDGQPNSHPQAPAYSCYRSHHAGQPTYHQGLRMPWPVASPDVLYSTPETGYSHLMRAERFAHVWLEQNGYAFDCITDLDLHRDPEQLNGYRTVLINGHSEYWSVEAYEGLDRYLTAGGTTVIFSGNTMFWRVTFNPDGSVMECRKFDNRIGGMPATMIGELYHSHDGKRGSLMRECGRPAWQVVGLECDGWGGITKDEIGIYHTETPDHFLFNNPEPVGLAKNETFGHAPDGGLPRAVGHEWDVRVSRLNSITKNVPPGESLPEEPAGIVTLARGVRLQTNALDYFTQPTTAPDGTVAEMIYWERLQGGRVFHAGAIAAGWALSGDPKLQTLIRNVLHHFGVRPN